MFVLRRYALGSALLLLAGCGGGGSSMPATATSQAHAVQTRQSASLGRMVSATGRIGAPAGLDGALSGLGETSPGWLSDDAKGPSAKVYVSDETTNAVYIYNAKSPTKPIGTITKGISEPLGNYVDPAGTLYVTNFNTNSLTVYPKGTTSPSATYTNGISEPIGVVVGTDGTIYVSEFQANTVVEFDKGKTSPSRTISISEPEGITLDAKNNLYLSYYNNATSAGSVETFKPKATTGTDLGTKVGFPGDLKLDKANDLLLGDQDNKAIEFFKRGSKTPYGNIAAGVDPYKLALNSTETLLYVASASTSVAIFDAKPSGMSTGTISGLRTASGVSLSPPPPFDL